MSAYESQPSSTNQQFAKVENIIYDLLPNIKDAIKENSTIDEMEQHSITQYDNKNKKVIKRKLSL